jgi:rifampicin phosphotransferase
MPSDFIHSSNISVQHYPVGGKAEGLLFLKEHQFNVPDFYIVPDPLIRSFITKTKRIKSCVDHWIKKYHLPEDSLWAVRSSAGTEDGTEHSFAGLFHTITNSSLAEIADAVKKVIDSAITVDNYSYGQKTDSSFSIILQKMVIPDYSGVLFTSDPIQPENNTMIIQVIPGLGEYLVSGKEVSLRGEYRNGTVNWINADEIFTGNRFDGKLTSISETGRQIVAATKPCISELAEGAKKLEQLKGKALDIEFCITNQQLFWLQVRPVTALNTPGPTFIYDSSNIGENYPGISLPLTISFVQYTYERAYTVMARHIGMSKKNIEANRERFRNMVGGIYGGLYYNITAWQQMLYQVPFGKKTSLKIDNLLGMEKAPFEPPAIRTSVFDKLHIVYKTILAFILLRRHKSRYVENCESTLRDFSHRSLQSMDHAQLAALYKQLDRKLLEDWLAPVLNGFYAMILFLTLKKFIRKSKLYKYHPNFTNDILYAQGDIISVQIVRHFQRLIRWVQDDLPLKKAFHDMAPDTLYRILPDNFPAFFKQVEEYLTLFGDRCDGGEMKMETLNYREDPLRFISLLKANTQGMPSKRESLENFDYKIVVKHFYRYRPVARLVLLLLIQKTLHLIRDRENYRFVRTRMIGMIRLIFRAIDDFLVKNKQIEMKGDSLYLHHKELIDINLAPSYPSLIARRKIEYENFRRINHAPRYKVKGKSIEPVFNTARDKSAEVIKGVGCCSGVVINTVKIITPETIAEGDFSGYILVAGYFEPGWINLFSQAAGIISEKGNLLSHTAILCREMGIPSIVGAKGITNMLHEGDLVEMDGGAGEIKKLSDGK